MPQQPPEPRHTVERFPGGVRIVLPSKKMKFFKIPFAVLWSIGAVLFFGIFMFVATISIWMMRQNLDSSFESISGYVCFNLMFLFFLVFMFAIFGSGFYSIFWQIKGREIIEIKENETLSICRQIFRWKSTKEYDLQDVEDLRVVPPIRTFSRQRKLFWQKILGKTGLLAFDYAGKSRHFSQDIDEAEAKMILAVLQEYLPE